MSIGALLQRASCLASLELQRKGFVPSPEECEKLTETSSRLSDALYGSTVGAPSALRDRVATQIAINRSIASAVRRLPDELLLLILNAGRCISTEKLKAGLLKVLPTPLGKDALLEAEVELRAYRERTAPNAPITPPPEAVNPKDFPLQAAFEVGTKPSPPSFLPVVIFTPSHFSSCA